MDVFQHYSVGFKSAPGKTCTGYSSWWIGNSHDDFLARSDLPYVQWDHFGFVNADAGLYSIDVGLQSLVAGEPLALYHSTFSILRASTWGKSFTATPAPVKKGKKITLTGIVQRIDWTGTGRRKKTMWMNMYAGAAVQVQYRAAGTSTYKTVKNVLTGSGGKVSTTITATKSGYWRLHLVTNDTTGFSTTAVDYVKVK